MIIVSIAFVLGVAHWIYTRTDLTEAQKATLDWMKYGLGIIAFTGNTLIIRIVFKGLDRDRIEEAIRKRVEKEFAK